MAGLRLGEALALTWADVDLAASKLVVRQSRTLGRTGTPKSGHGRTVPLAPELARELARLGLRRCGSAENDLVFLGKQGAFVDAHRFRARRYDAERRARIAPRRSPKQLRHTFAVTIARHGTPLAVLQRWMGHGSITVTEIYSQFVPGDREAAMVSAALAETAAA